MKANGTYREERMAKEFKFGLMALFTKGTGRTIKLTVEDV